MSGVKDAGEEESRAPIICESPIKTNQVITPGTVKPLEQLNLLESSDLSPRTGESIEKVELQERPEDLYTTIPRDFAAKKTVEKITPVITREESEKDHDSSKKDLQTKNSVQDSKSEVVQMESAKNVPEKTFPGNTPDSGLPIHPAMMKSPVLVKPQISGQPRNSFQGTSRPPAELGGLPYRPVDANLLAQWRPAPRPPNDYVQYNRPPNDYVQYNRPPNDYVQYNRPPNDYVQYNRPPNDYVQYNRPPNDQFRPLYRPPPIMLRPNQNPNTSFRPGPPPNEARPYPDYYRGHYDEAKALPRPPPDFFRPRPHPDAFRPRPDSPRIYSPEQMRPGPVEANPRASGYANYAAHPMVIRQPNNQPPQLRRVETVSSHSSSQAEMRNFNPRPPPPPGWRPPPPQGIPMQHPGVRWEFRPVTIRPEARPPGLRPEFESRRDFRPTAMPSPILRPNIQPPNLSARRSFENSNQGPAGHSVSNAPLKRISLDENEIRMNTPHIVQRPPPDPNYSELQRRPTFTTLSRQKSVSVTQLSFEAKLNAYRENAKKTSDPKILFEYARFCIEQGEKKVAAGGYLEAQHYLALAYEDDGRFDLAYTQYSAAAKKAYAPSCAKVGFLAEQGLGCKVNYRLALQMYTKAATAGDKDAMYRLGLAELRGELNLRRDVGKAVKWFKRGAAVADKDHAEPIYQLALLYESGAPPDVQPDKNYARSLLLEACQLDYLPAIFRLAQCFEYGTLGCPVDIAESHRLYQVAASKGDAESQLALAGWYISGVDGYVPRDEARAFILTKQASDQDLPHAKYALGYLYEKGMGVREDVNQAKALYLQAAEAGEERALKRLQEIDPSMAQSTKKKKNRGIMSFFSKN